jgi:hypothetical protein
MKIQRHIFAVFLLAIATMTNAQALPKEVTRLVAAVVAIPGITEAQVEKTYLPDVSVADLALPGANADLPIAALRRSKGALKEEILVSMNFRIQRNEAGLRALEFLWWVRDQSRGGENIQIRPIALPPLVADKKQLGSTLRFTIDWFYSTSDQDLLKLLRALDDKAKALELLFSIYKTAF